MLILIYAVAIVGQKEPNLKLQALVVVVYHISQLGRGS
jgi:hypothetical protein